MSAYREQPGRASATRDATSRGAMSRDAGLLRIRSLTKGAAVTAALGSVAIGVVLSHPAQSQAATGSTGGSNTQAAQTPVQAPAPPSASDPNNNQSQLAAPAQPPAAMDPQAPPPAAVSGGS